MILLSTLTRSIDPPKETILDLESYCLEGYCGITFNYRLSVGSNSIYEGHKNNLENFDKWTEYQKPKNDDDIIIFCHDDVEILSNP